MESLAIALVVIAVLYFIDKHSLWKRAALVTLSFVLILGLGLGTWYGHQMLKEKREAKQRIARQDNVEACVKRLSHSEKPDLWDQAALGNVCEENPEATVLPTPPLNKNALHFAVEVVRDTVLYSDQEQQHKVTALSRGTVVLDIDNDSLVAVPSSALISLAKNGTEYVVTGDCKKGFVAAKDLLKKEDTNPFDPIVAEERCHF